MNRRDFFRTVAGVGAAVAVVPVVTAPNVMWRGQEIQYSSAPPFSGKTFHIVSDMQADTKMVHITGRDQNDNYVEEDVWLHGEEHDMWNAPMTANERYGWNWEK